MYEREKHCELYVAVEPKSYYISGTCVAAVGRFSNFYSLHSDIHRFLNWAVGGEWMTTYANWKIWREKIIGNIYH